MTTERGRGLFDNGYILHFDSRLVEVHSPHGFVPDYSVMVCFLLLKLCNRENLPTHLGTDLKAITNSSIVIAQLHNSGMQYDNRADSTSDNPICNVWDVFTHGFHLYCNYGSANNPVIVAPSLHVAVLNP